MKIIKFRVWTGINMEYDIVAGRFGNFYVNPGAKGDGLDEKDSASLTPFNTKYPDSVPIMQFTGLKDKNGKEIYEGDIVKFHHFYDGGGVELEEEFKAKVEIRELGVYLVAKESHNYILNYYGVHEESFEIIGNIYSNPELLSPQ